MAPRLRTAVIGCGLIGSRRAQEASEHPRTSLQFIVDVVPDRRERLAAKYGCRAAEHWKQAVDDAAVDLVVVSTPNLYTAEIAVAALGAGSRCWWRSPPAGPS